MFTPRPYQVDAVNSALEYFHGPSTRHAFEILPTGSGKSVVISNITKELKTKTLVFQPSKEILEQNYAKYAAYGFRAGIYSASLNTKHVDDVTFATIGSVAKRAYLFRDFKNVIIDECHLVNPADGMYQSFLSRIRGCKILGLTATPYRLVSAGFNGVQLKLINNTFPRIFSDCLYYIQNNVLFDAGHLAKLRYFSFNEIDRNALLLNGDGSDFNEASMAAFSRENNMGSKLIAYTNKILTQRQNALVFCSCISEANTVVRGIPGAEIVTGMTEQNERSRILNNFKAGRTKCLVNVGVLTTGFDYPALESVIIGRPTMSLSLFYQIVGRVMRPHKDKDCGWVVDLCGNIDFFGKIETMKIREIDGQLSVWNEGRRLTDVELTKN